MNNERQADPARLRFIVLMVMRASGVAMMLLGMGIMAARWIEPSDIVGGAIFLAGFLESIIVPRMLARKWRTPPNP